MSNLSPAEKKMMKALNREQGAKFKDDQLMEWGTHELEAQKGEKVFHVKEYGVNIAIKL